MYAIPLDDDGTELPRPLEPWQAQEFLDHMERGREFIARHIATAGRRHGPGVGRAYLRGTPRRPPPTAAGSTASGPAACWSGESSSGRWTSARASRRRAAGWSRPRPAGACTKAVRVIIDWVVEERGFHRVEWHVAAANAPSIAVARRLGMTRDGVLRESYPRRGKRHDIEIWSVLAPEWRAGRQAS